MAEDSWRLNRISAIGENIFAVGIDNYGSVLGIEEPQIHATLTATVTFARDADQLKFLSLYEQRLNRSIEKNLKLLRHLQADEQAKLETKAALREKALVEARLLHAHSAAAAGARAAAATNTSDEATVNGQPEAAQSTAEINGFVFSSAEIVAAIDKHYRLNQAREAASASRRRAAGSETRAFAA